MAASSLHHFFFLSTLVIILVIVHTQYLHDQKTLLLQLKSELIFYNSESPLMWFETDGDCCHWDGVECDGVGRVISLLLDFKGIRGGLNESSSLFRLRYLEKLNLAYNSFSTHIPREIHRLTHLRHLNLSNAGFEGQIPVELSFLKRLVTLDLSTDLHISTLWYLKLEHPSLKMMIQNLTKLTTLNLDGVDISVGGSEWSQAISSSLPHLRILSLRECNLSGPFHPSFSQLHSLSVLQLDSNNLSTTIPNFVANFSKLTIFSCRNCSLRGSSLRGNFPEMIFQVPTLQELDLSSNDLLKGTIPNFFLSRALWFIDISHCNIVGPIPSMLSNLTELTYLDLSFNNLMGSLTNSHFEGLSKLVGLYLENNSLKGNIPNSLFGLTSLQYLILSNNKFSGQINEFPTNISNIVYLDLGHNSLYGSIPHSLFGLSLNFIDLSYNQFSGQFNKIAIANTSYMMCLYLSANQLQGHIPNLSNNLYIEFMDLSDNQITGDIPSWVWNITTVYLNLSYNLFENLQKPYNNFSSLCFVDLHSNQLSGELPSLPKGVGYVNYSNNKFGKFIPPTFFDNVNIYLRFVSLANNSLSGAIPTSIFNITFLVVLDLSFNKLSDDISPHLLKSLKFLQVINLKGNYINGVIPDQFPVSCTIISLDLSYNNLSGTIPKSIANCKSLKVMDVGYNNFDDSFPCMMPSSLRVLILPSNRFHGELRCEKSWPSLQIVDISSNNFSDTLHPLNFSNWRGMVLEGDAHVRPNHSASGYINVGYMYQVEVTLTVKGCEVELAKIWPDFTSIDFSSNNFHGVIPDAIGNLTSLYLLNLSHNALTDAIPKSLGALKELGSLDLSANQLRGRIPEEIAHLTFLSFLNLSFNELVGMIPHGPQFQTFSAASFEGNPGLCGSPLSRSCSNTNESGSISPKVKDEEIEWGYVCAALGYVVGLGSIVWVLLFCRSFRERYFDKIEEVFEKMFDRRRRRGRRVVSRNEGTQERRRQ